MPGIRNVMLSAEAAQALASFIRKVSFLFGLDAEVVFDGVKVEEVKGTGHLVVSYDGEEREFVTVIPLGHWHWKKEEKEGTEEGEGKNVPFVIFQWVLGVRLPLSVEVAADADSAVKQALRRFVGIEDLFAINWRELSPEERMEALRNDRCFYRP